MSSISYLALPGKSFAGNWNPFVFSLSLPVATWIAVRWFLPYYRNSGEVSAYALLETPVRPLGPRLRQRVLSADPDRPHGLVMYLMALPMQVIFGWDIRLIILVTGISVTLYSFVGGIVAVIWADAIQAIVLMAGPVLCLAVMLLASPAARGRSFAIAAEHDKFSLRQLRLDTVAPAHILGGLHLRSRRQPPELRHRPELHPALHRLQLPTAKPARASGWAACCTSRLGPVLPDRHHAVRLLHHWRQGTARRQADCRPAAADAVWSRSRHEQLPDGCLKRSRPATQPNSTAATQN